MLNPYLAEEGLNGSAMKKNENFYLPVPPGHSADRVGRLWIRRRLFSSLVNWASASSIIWRFKMSEVHDYMTFQDE